MFFYILWIVFPALVWPVAHWELVKVSGPWVCAGLPSIWRLQVNELSVFYLLLGNFLVIRTTKQVKRILDYTYLRTFVLLKVLVANVYETPIDVRSNKYSHARQSTRYLLTDREAWNCQKRIECDSVHVFPYLLSLFFYLLNQSITGHLTTKNQRTPPTNSPSEVHPRYQTTNDLMTLNHKPKRLCLVL